MKNLRIKSILLSALAMMVGLGAVVSAPAFAEGDAVTHDVQISPPSQRITLDPGTTYEGSFKVNNIGKTDFEYTIKIMPYSVVGDDYAPDYKTEGTYNQLANWITVKKESGKLQPDETDTVNYTVVVPEDVPYGGQYAALGVTVDNGGGSLKTVTQVAMILYAKVPGETREEGSIKENSVPAFVVGGNKVAASSLVENTGNVHADAVYTMKVYPLGSSEEIYTNEDEPETRLIMPESRRYNSLEWENTPALGIYTVEQTVEFLGQTSTTSKMVIVCPVWLLVIFIALILAIIFTLVSRARARKQGKKDRGESKKHNEEKEDK